MRLAVTVLLLTHTLAEAQLNKALDYLTVEVRNWPQQNQCFSCHNNGDGARALFIARRAVPRQTLDWLQSPNLWEKAGANPGISDRTLASIQYAAALSEAEPRNREALRLAAAILAKSQSNDGSWIIDTLGSPATYGTALATSVARSTLIEAEPKQFANSIASATAWLGRLKASNVPEAAASQNSNFLLDAQNRDGGWGPWKLAPSEPFDTAIAILALDEKRALGKDAVARGRAYLLRTQQPSGGWMETTRPAGGQSYAQHISTTAWAAIALLRKDSKRN